MTPILRSLFQKLYQSKYIFGAYLLRWLILCSIIGVSIGVVSAVFLYSLVWVANTRESHLWLIFLLPIGGLFVGLLYHYWGRKVVSGNNLVITQIEKPSEEIPFRMAPLIYFGTIITHLLGGSAGREGTAIQMAASISDQFAHPFGLKQKDRKILLLAAVAAGFGALFGTPFTGVVFALELVFLGKLRREAIFPSLLAALLAHTIVLFLNAPHTYYHIPKIPIISWLSIFYSVLAGIIFGICALVFSRSLHAVSQLSNKLIKFPPFRPFIGGIIMVLLVTVLGTTKYIGLGLPTIVASFSQSLPTYDFVLKMLLTIITLAFGFKGGEVTPLFFIGAALGNALALFLPLPIGLLAGMGFVAVFAGATHTPIACSVMAIELFGVDCGLYAAIACFVAYFFSGKMGIYSEQTVAYPKHKRYFSNGQNL